MITVHQRQEQRVVECVVAPGAPLPPNALWIDLHAPTPEETHAVAQQLGIELPTRNEAWKNEVLNRVYQENGVATMTASIITKTDYPYPQTSAVTFILTPSYLLTMRDIAPTSFKNFAQRLHAAPQPLKSPVYVLEGLLEEIIHRVAYNSEVVVEALDALSHNIFGADVLKEGHKNPSQAMKDVLKQLGAAADLNSKINESLYSLSRMLCFFKQLSLSDAEMDASIGVLATDVAALMQQTAFLSDKITFQLDATLGMINVEQNLIIKIFSVVAVFFLPPTLISSLYGMNFHHMPELDWLYGYPFAIFLMFLCALVPFLYFRKKGWL